MKREDYWPVVSAEEMGRLEAWDKRGGAEERAFIAEAGNQVAQVAEQMGARNVLLLVGSGHNGADAWAAGIELLKRHIAVRAYVLKPLDQCAPLNRLFGEAFLRAGGSIRPLDESTRFEPQELLIDGLVGTGFHGPVEGALLRAIETANRSGNPLLAIDIPSGLDPTTGQVSNHAIVATKTVALGLPKSGYFQGKGWSHVGFLEIRNFGLSDEAIAQANPWGWIPKPDKMKLPPLVRTWHKYSRGFVVGFGGSKELPGAMKLAGWSALHTGAGIVKLFSLAELGELPPELIGLPFEEKGWDEALKKAQAVFIGPGLGRSKEVHDWLNAHLGSISQPCVLDADALFFLRDIQTWPKHSVLTPHHGEMERLLDSPPSIDKVAVFAAEKNVLIVLKGAPTFLFSPGEKPLIIPRGDPGMATAGAGDVLTGMVAALLAQKMPLLEGSALAVTLHALAGERAAAHKTSYGYTASDLIAYLPEAFSALGSI